MEQLIQEGDVDRLLTVLLQQVHSTPAETLHIVQLTAAGAWCAGSSRRLGSSWLLAHSTAGLLLAGGYANPSFTRICVGKALHDCRRSMSSVARFQGSAHAPCTVRRRRQLVGEL